MPDSFLRLSPATRSEALAFAEDASGRPADILEKDVWVVWALSALFGSPFTDHLCFKGGTSLSKAYGVIERFSEDVDVTYDVRKLLGGEYEGADADPLPPNRSHANKWSKTVRDRLPVWVGEVVLPEIRSRVDADGAPTEVRSDGDCLILEYEQTALTRSEYVPPRVLVEFGARSTGEPLKLLPVTCDAAAHLADLGFPATSARVMAAERTFWEKATAAHAFCLGEGRLAERHARHWYDLVRLDDAGFAAAAFADRDLGRLVADYKSYFFRMRDAGGEMIDYIPSIEGSLRLVPTGGSRRALQDDYGRMVEAGLLEAAAASFDEIMNRCGDLEERANGC